MIVEQFDPLPDFIVKTIMNRMGNHSMANISEKKIMKVIVALKKLLIDRVKKRHVLSLRKLDV